MADGGHEDTRRGGEELADQVLAALKSLNAVGARRAVTQARLASVVGCPQRLICDATLALNRRGVEVCSTCGSPPGVFLADTVAELRTYAEQLRSRLLGNGKRMAAVNRIARQWIAQSNVEPCGQGRLFA